MSNWDDWVHAMFSAYGHWIPGDERRFRDHGHRIRSSGTCKNPPPITEHAGLRRCARAITGEPVSFPGGVRPVIAEALAAKWLKIKVAASIISVGDQHVHALILAGIQDAGPIVGKAKQYASLRVSAQLPGSIWGKAATLSESETRTTTGT